MNILLWVKHALNSRNIYVLAFMIQPRSGGVLLCVNFTDDVETMHRLFTPSTDDRKYI